MMSVRLQAFFPSLNTLTPWKESYDQPRQHIEKQRHYFVNKGPSSQGCGFPVVMYGCESWTIKKAEHRRIDAFELWYWRKLLRVPWTVRKSFRMVHPKGNQSWVFVGRTDVEAKTPILWPPDAKSWLIWKDPDGGKDWGQEENGMTDGWIASQTQWTWIWVDSGSWWWTRRPGMLRFMGLQKVGHDWATELNCTEPIHSNSNQIISTY